MNPFLEYSEALHGAHIEKEFESLSVDEIMLMYDQAGDTSEVHQYTSREEAVEAALKSAEVMGGIPETLRGPVEGLMALFGPGGKYANHKMKKEE